MKKEQQNFEYGNNINYAKVVSSFGQRMFELLKKTDVNKEMKKQQIQFLNRCLGL